MEEDVKRALAGEKLLGKGRGGSEAKGESVRPAKTLELRIERVLADRRLKRSRGGRSLKIRDETTTRDEIALGRRRASRRRVRRTTRETRPTAMHAARRIAAKMFSVYMTHRTVVRMIPSHAIDTVLKPKARAKERLSRRARTPSRFSISSAPARWRPRSPPPRSTGRARRTASPSTADPSIIAALALLRARELHEGDARRAPSRLVTM